MINPLWIRDDHLAHFSIPSHPAFNIYNLLTILKWIFFYALLHLGSIFPHSWNNPLVLWQDPDSQLLLPFLSIPHYIVMSTASWYLLHDFSSCHQYSPFKCHPQFQPWVWNFFPLHVDLSGQYYDFYSRYNASYVMLPDCYSNLRLIRQQCHEFILFPFHQQ